MTEAQAATLLDAVAHLVELADAWDGLFGLTGVVILLGTAFSFGILCATLVLGGRS